MDEVILRYTTTGGFIETIHVDRTENHLNLALKDIASIDLLPLIWCTDLERLSLQYNRIETIDLSPLTKCPTLEEINLSHNNLREIDLSPLVGVTSLRELRLEKNNLRKIDVSPLFECPNLSVFRKDDFISMTASIFLRSVGSWPDVLMDEYHRILWVHGESSPRT
ncbi:MAG: leucine-rich repeat domain-containing protein [Candidatus Thorarchaeota archaeon]